MGRLTIDESAWPLLDKFHYLLVKYRMGISKNEAIGMVFCLWHTSQKIQAYSLSSDDILFYMGTHPSDNDCNIIDALLQCGLIKKVSDKNYEIIGNAIHIDNIKRLKELASLGGTKRALKRALEKTQASALPNTVQCSSVQFSSIQDIYKKNSEIQGCIEEWGNTLERYGIKKNPTLDEVQIARLIQTHGEEKTKLALVGARFEAASKDYNPAKHVNIRRLLKPDIFEKLVNLGAQNLPTVLRDARTGEIIRE